MDSNAQTKLFRFGNAGSEKPGVILSSGKRLDVSGFKEDYNEAFFATNGMARLEEWLTANAAKCPEVPAGARIASCVARPSKIVAIGLNYAKHAKESGAPIPTEPVIFMKATTALCGPNDNVIIPKNSTKLDWECELAIIIGKKASYVSEQEAVNYIAGYSIMNDYSERAFQQQSSQWDKGKSADTFAPLGPWIVKPADVGDVQNLKLWLKVNGTVMQESNTNDMIFKAAFLVSYVSHYMTLLPGDVITTGTPSGVGMGRKPPVFLKAGDVVELGIEKLGEQRQVVVQ
ncbi:MAG: fumarylacetoacetate hydrolase family protein [Bacteroidetes bacterium]|nr:fumarylacetoacetate hydrolase family protein [Bacteroidota bacterium]